MSQTKKPTRRRPEQPQGTQVNGPSSDVLTLSEAAAYLRLSEADVMELVQHQGLPARQVGGQWRFLKAALQRWLGASQKEGNDGIWAAAGTLKDDPYLEEMLMSIERMRGKAMPEDR
jgi:excisionase family DNA binding protein